MTVGVYFAVGSGVYVSHIKQPTVRKKGPSHLRRRNEKGTWRTFSKQAALTAGKEQAEQNWMILATKSYKGD